MSVRSEVFLIALLAGVPAARAQAPGEAYQRGLSLARSGKPAEALVELRRAEQLDPSSPKVQNAIGAVLAQMGRLDEAEQAYAKALAQAPGFVPARKNRAANAFARKDYQTAAREFEALRAVVPDDFVPPLFLGLLAIEESRLEAALDHLTAAHQRAPGNPKVILPLIRVEFRLGLRERALKRAQQVEPGLSAPEAFDLGVLLAQFGANDEALAIFSALRRADPKSYDVGFNLALLEYRRGRPEQALAITDDLVAAGQPPAELFNLRGWIYNRMRLRDRARESLEKAVALEPANAEHYLDLSTLLMNQPDHASALRVLTGGMKHNPRDARLRVQAGIIARSLRKKEEAEGWYRKALAIDPRSGPAHLALADLLFETGRRAEAFSQLEHGIRLLPGYALLHYAYGALLLETAVEPGALALGQAESMLQQAAALDPSFAGSQYVLGKLYLRKGDERAAEASFEKAHALDPKGVNAAYQLSRLAARRGDKEKAAALAQVVRSAKAEALREDERTFQALVEQGLRTNSNSGFEPLQNR